MKKEKAELKKLKLLKFIDTIKSDLAKGRFQFFN